MVPLPNQTSATVAAALVKEVFLKFVRFVTVIMGRILLAI
jgi:hypothetical protein